MDQSGVMHPSLAYMALGLPKHVMAAILKLTEGGPNAMSIRPTGFVMDETRTHYLRIIELAFVFYRLS